MIRNWLLNWPLVEGVIGIVIAGVYFRELRDLPAEERDIGKRQLAANVITAQLNTTVVAGTVTIGLLGAFSAGIAPAANTTLNAHIFNAAILAFLSISCALWGLGVVSAVVSREEVVTMNRNIAITSVLSLYLFLAAIARLGLSLLELLYP